MIRLEKIQVITNNEYITKNFGNKLDIIFIDGQYIDVLVAVRDKIHKSNKIITHPLMGSMKPNETPYRSIIIQECGGIDFQSIEIIESSIETCKKFIKDNPPPVWSDKILEDFRFVDKRLFESALESLFI